MYRIFFSLLSFVFFSMPMEREQHCIDLHTLVFNGEYKKVSSLLSSKKININSRNKLGQTPLHIAVIKKDIGFSRLLLDAGAYVNAMNDDGDTPLHIAATTNAFEISKLLLESGAHINAKNDDGKTPLHLAVDYSKIDLLKQLLQCGADSELEDNTGRTSLMTTVIQNKPDALEAMLSIVPKPNINKYTSEGKNLLHIAANQGFDRVVEILLDHGANPNLRCGKYGNMPIHIAALRGYSNIILNLAACGADPDVKNSFGQTPLIIVTESNNIVNASILIDCGANKTIADNRSRTPYSIARMLKNEEMMALLNNNL